MHGHGSWPSLFRSDQVQRPPPTRFNDPLDCNLSITPDISPRRLSDLLKHLKGPEREDEWHESVATALHYAREEGDPKTNADARSYLVRMLTDEVASEVKKEFDGKGVLSFSETWQSVLMWSHYADEHRGICLEFDTSELPHERLAAVNYDGDRSVRASDIFAWKIEGNEEAGKRAYETHFYCKAPGWRYEQEWRDIAPNPMACRDYRITAIYFGFRCDYAVKVALVKMLGANSRIELHDVYIAGDSFDLLARPVDRDEIDALGMREPEGIELAQWLRDLEGQLKEIMDTQSGAEEAESHRSAE